MRAPLPTWCALAAPMSTPSTCPFLGASFETSRTRTLQSTSHRAAMLRAGTSGVQRRVGRVGRGSKQCRRSSRMVAEVRWASAPSATLALARVRASHCRHCYKLCYTATPRGDQSVVRAPPTAHDAAHHARGSGAAARPPPLRCRRRRPRRRWWLELRPRPPAPPPPPSASAPEEQHRHPESYIEFRERRRQGVRRRQRRRRRRCLGRQERLEVGPARFCPPPHRHAL